MLFLLATNSSIHEDEQSFFILNPLSSQFSSSCQLSKKSIEILIHPHIISSVESLSNKM